VAFAGLDHIIRDRSEKSGIGFGAQIHSKTDNPFITEYLSSLQPEDLVKYGLIPEFIGRLPIIATLQELDEDALMTILTQPKNALVKQYQRLLKLDGIELEIREDALLAVAKKAMERKTGARGLRSILENALLETMYELPSKEGVQKVSVDASTINEGARPLFIYEDAEKSA